MKLWNLNARWMKLHVVPGLSNREDCGGVSWEENIQQEMKQHYVRVLLRNGEVDLKNFWARTSFGMRAAEITTQMCLTNKKMWELKTVM